MLACRASSDRIFDVMEPYQDMKDFFFVLVLLGVFFYFVTSSDSGSFVDDVIASQGLENPPVIQKIFWAFTEGAVATALLEVGGSNALSALQSVSIVAGLPYTIAICFLCTSLYRALKIDQEEEDICSASTWTTNVFDFVELYLPSASGSNITIDRRVASTLLGLIPFPGVKAAAECAYGVGMYATLISVSTLLLWLVWIGMLIASFDNGLFAYLGWTFFILMCFVLTSIRSNLRKKFNIYGAMHEDFFTVLMLYPFAISQMELQAEFGAASKEVVYS